MKRTLFGDTFETLLKNVPQIEELRNIPCKCLCDVHKKLGNGHADLTIDANYSDHSYSDALIVWQKCARHMYHHYLCQLLETCKVVDRAEGGEGGAGKDQENPRGRLPVQTSRCIQGRRKALQILSASHNRLEQTR